MKKYIIGLISGIILTGTIVFATDILMDAKSIGYSSEYTNKTNVADALTDILENGLGCPKGYICEPVCTPLSTTIVGETVNYAGLDWKVVSTDEDGTILISAENYETGAFDQDGSSTYAGSTSYDVLNNDLLEDKELLKDKADYNCLASQGKYNNKDYYIRLPEKTELSENISNDSETPFWTQTADENGLYFGLSSGLEGIKYEVKETKTVYYGGLTLGIIGYPPASEIEHTIITEIDNVSNIDPNLDKIDKINYTTKTTYYNTTTATYVCNTTAANGGCPSVKFCGPSASNNGFASSCDYYTYAPISGCTSTTEYTIDETTYDLGLRPVIKVKK